MWEALAQSSCPRTGAVERHQNEGIGTVGTATAVVVSVMRWDFDSHRIREFVNLPRGFRRRFGLRAGTDVEGTIQRVTLGASLTAENFWLLACSAMLASIGPDVGSTAVIIGATTRWKRPA